MADMIDEKIFDFVFDAAFLDATRRTAYSRNREKTETDKEEMKKIVREYIDDIFLGKKPDFYEYEKMIEDKAVKDASFTFGNAQKLINMTAKYFFISCYGKKDIRELFSECHCPMDGIMIKKVISKLSEKNVRENYKKLKSDISWGNLAKKNGEIPEEYTAFQDAVGYLCKIEGVSPLEYDFLTFSE